MQIANKRGRDARTGKFIPVKVAEQRKSNAKFAKPFSAHITALQRKARPA
jgi:hypothetical protein